MHNLPITLGFFTSTRGHWNRKGDWRVTLDHWNKQVPLELFNLIAHVKVTPGEEMLASDMSADLQRRGFHVLQTIGNWQRGLSHGAAYLGDQGTMSKEPRVYQRPYFLMLEDDTPLLAHGERLEDVLLRSCRLLESNHELVSVRTIRRGDYEGGIPQLADAEDGRAFYSPYTDYQTPLLRSLDFHRLGIVLETRPDLCNTVQCEALWAAILTAFSRNPLRHLVWKPDWVEALHIGIEHPEAELAKL